MRTSILRSLYRKNNRRRNEPGEALFRELRVRLTLWYCGILCAALVLFGVALYLGTQHFLMSQIHDSVSGFAHSLQHDPSGSPCSAPPQNQSDSSPDQQNMIGPGLSTINPLLLCFDQQGNLLPGQYPGQLPSAFGTNTVVETALQSPAGEADDTVDAGGSLGTIYRYALVTTDHHSGHVIVLMVGEYIQVQENELSLLLTLLLSIGGGALVCAGLGGLFLANRALVPARISWTNQQRFIADASHELRTPLTLLRADAEVLLRGRKHLEQEDAALLEDIVAETNHMGNITTNLLTLARLDSNTSHREHEVISLVKLARAGVQRVQALARERGILVQEMHLQNPYVIGDPMLLEQAVLVLLDNAIKYNRERGQINVRISAQDGQARLEIQDTGIGIAAEHLPYLGERFYRVDKARSRQAGGTGLGLSIARSTARTHNGQLILTSIAGQGTVATLLLPLANKTLSESNKIASEAVHSE